MPETEKFSKYIFAQKRSIKSEKKWGIFFLNGKTTQLDNRRVVNKTMFAQCDMTDVCASGIVFDNSMHFQTGIVFSFIKE